MAASPADSPRIRTGDVDDNGRIDLDDILLVMAAFSSSEPCEPPCLADICCCGPYVLDLDDLVAVLQAFSGATVICPPMECPRPAARIRVECENADGELELVERNADGATTVLGGQRCVYTSVPPAAEPGD